MRDGIDTWGMQLIQLMGMPCLLCSLPVASFRCRRLTFPSHVSAREPLSGVQLLLVCDSYQGLDQQFTVELPGAASGQAAAPAGQAARRARRQQQDEEQRPRAASGESGDQTTPSPPVASPTGLGDGDGGTGGQPSMEQEMPGSQPGTSSRARGTGSDTPLPQRQPRGRRPRGEAGVSQTLRCCQAGAGGGDERDEGEQF